MSQSGEEVSDCGNIIHEYSHRMDMLIFYLLFYPILNTTEVGLHHGCYRMSNGLM